MTPGQLVKAVSIALDVPEETVVQHDRNLVVAGLRTTGARGRNAPAVSTLDAARLFTAVLGSVRAKDSIATVRAFEEKTFDPVQGLTDEKLTEMAAWFKEQGNLEGERAALAILGEGTRNEFFDPAIHGLHEKHNFVEAIASLISAASVPADLDQYLQRFAGLTLDCQSYGDSVAHIGKLGSTGGVRYAPKPRNRVSKTPEPANEVPRYKRYARFYGIAWRRTAYGSAIMLLGKAFEHDGLSFGTTRDALASLLGPQKRPTKTIKRAG